MGDKKEDRKIVSVRYSCREIKRQRSLGRVRKREMYRQRTRERWGLSLSELVKGREEDNECGA